MPGFLSVRPAEWATPALTGLRVYVGGDNHTVAIWDGTTWTSSAVTVFNPAAFVKKIRSIVVTPNGAVYCRSSNGDEVAKSVDGGVTWALVSIPTVVGFGVQSMGVDAAGWLYLNYTTEIQRSTDGGATWAIFGEISPKNEEVALAAFATSGEVWIPMGNTTDQIAQRFNADGTGRLSVAGTDNFNLGYMAAAPDTADRAWLFHGHNATECYRVNGTVATTVDPSSGTADVMSILDLGAGTVLAVCEADTFSTSSSLVRSTDSGATWTTVASGASYDVATDAIGPLLMRDPTTATTIYYVASGGLFVSTDSGVTWAAAVGGAIPTTINSCIAVGGS